MTVYNIRIDGDYEFSSANKKEADSVYKLVLQYGRAWDDVKPDSIVVLKEEKRPMEFRP